MQLSFLWFWNLERVHEQFTFSNIFFRVIPNDLYTTIFYCMQFTVPLTKPYLLFFLTL